MDLDNFGLEILQIRVVEVELTLESPVRHTATALEHFEYAIQDFIERHRSSSWSMPNRDASCATCTRYCREKKDLSLHTVDSVWPSHYTRPSAVDVAYPHYGATVIVTSAPLVNLWRRLLLGLFCLSGISGLLYEVAWTRMLHLLFGDTVLAVSTVLASFMAGLALGSFWSGRYVDRRPRVLALYAALEAGIGVSAVALPVVLQALTPLYVWLHQYLHASFWLFSVVRFLLAFCLLFVPTTLMGATLPVLSRYMIRRTATLGWRVGTLYALNTAGAVLGCFLAGYVLIGRLGLSQTIWIGAALNLAIALVAWVIQRCTDEELPEPEAPLSPLEDTPPALY